MTHQLIPHRFWMKSSRADARFTQAGRTCATTHKQWSNGERWSSIIFDSLLFFRFESSDCVLIGKIQLKRKFEIFYVFFWELCVIVFGWIFVACFFYWIFYEIFGSIIEFLFFNNFLAIKNREQFFHFKTP